MRFGFWGEKWIAIEALLPWGSRGSKRMGTLHIAHGKELWHDFQERYDHFNRYIYRYICWARCRIWTSIFGVLA